jgi:hypothetical protein
MHGKNTVRAILHIILENLAVNGGILCWDVTVYAKHTEVQQRSMLLLSSFWNLSAQSVVIVSDYRLEERGSIPAEVKNVSSSLCVRPVLRHTQPPK